MNRDNATTEIISKVAEAVVAAQKRPSGEIPAAHPWKCEQEYRLDQIDARLDDHSTRIKATEAQLGAGNERFVRLEAKLEAVSEKLGELADTIKGAVRWVLGIAGTAAAAGILWAMSQAGKGTP